MSFFITLFAILVVVCVNSGVVGQPARTYSPEVIGVICKDGILLCTPSFHRIQKMIPSKPSLLRSELSMSEKHQRRRPLVVAKTRWFRPINRLVRLTKNISVAVAGLSSDVSHCMDGIRKMLTTYYSKYGRELEPTADYFALKLSKWFRHAEHRPLAISIIIAEHDERRGRKLLRRVLPSGLISHCEVAVSTHFDDDEEALGMLHTSLQVNKAEGGEKKKVECVVDGTIEEFKRKMQESLSGIASKIKELGDSDDASTVGKAGVDDEEEKDSMLISIFTKYTPQEVQSMTCEQLRSLLVQQEYLSAKRNGRILTSSSEGKGEVSLNESEIGEELFDTLIL